MSPTTRWRSQPTMGGRSAVGVPLPFPESRLFVDTRLNLMLVGPQSSLQAAIVALMPHLRHPICTCRDGVALHLPPRPRGTLVVQEVGRLNRDEQQRLLQWLDLAAGNVQVISTTSEPLFTQVECRAFLDELYYRLNVLRVQISHDGVAQTDE